MHNYYVGIYKKLVIMHIFLYNQLVVVLVIFTNKEVMSLSLVEMLSYVLNVVLSTVGPRHKRKLWIKNIKFI